jgi:hypothetical protein
VFPGARIRDDFLQGSSPGTEGTVSETGWSNSGILIITVLFGFEH